ncbi:MAG: rod shape-determining protein MreC [Hespellia sp.]|nr:rod shape-determining protein MreC [Hespellia sp.]
MRKKNQSSLSNKYWLMAISAICCILMILSLVSSFAATPFKEIANITVIPMQKGINQMGMFLSDFTSNFETLQSVKAENKALQEKLDILTIENNNLQQEKYELDRLQELYKLDQNYSDYKKIGAHVISKDPGNWFSTFTIDKGSADGIKVDQNVMAGSGLVGIVTSTSTHWATVRSIIDDSSNVSAMVLSSSDRCMVRGDLSLMTDGKIQFEQLENNDNVVPVGEQIVTSYISDKYLQGILIGYVNEINVDSSNLTRSGYITPAVDFRNLQEVLVITTTKADLKEADNSDTTGE